MKPVTVWDVMPWHGPTWEFNHVEVGHSQLNVPAPINAWQKQMWRNCKWRKTLTYEVNGVVPSQIY